MISNHVTLIGRLTRDVELRSTTTGKNVASFTVAVNKPYNKEHEHPEADFFRCTAWEKTGEFVSKYFSKGDKIAVAGRLANREYDDKEGKKQQTTEVVVEEVEFVEKKNTVAAEKQEGKPAKKEERPKQTSKEDLSDELPFN